MIASKASKGDTNFFPWRPSYLQHSNYWGEAQASKTRQRVQVVTGVQREDGVTALLLKRVGLSRQLYVSVP